MTTPRRSPAPDPTDAHSATQTPTRRFVIELPWPRPPLRANDRDPNPHAHARRVADVRSTVAWLARQARLPTGSHLTVGLHYAPGHNRRMDSHNLHPTIKAAVDALARGPRRDWVGLALVPDDDDRYVTITPPRILRPPTPGPRCWLTVEITP